MTSEQDVPMTELRIGKMSRTIIALLGVLLAATAGVGTYVWQQETVDKRDATISSLRSELAKVQSSAVQASTMNRYTSTKGALVTVYTPTRGAVISNPLGVIGEVPGGWAFEATFPVELQDSTGTTISRGSGQVLGDWASSKPAPFSVQLIYADAPKGAGTLILHKDNVSGLAQNNDEVRIPVRF